MSRCTYRGRMTHAILAGATGDLGGRILRALLARGIGVTALVRPANPTAELDALGAHPVIASPTDVDALADAMRGADVVISALNGLRDVIVDRQSALLDAAVRAGVPRFIPSDYALDFTRTLPGHNRNLDLRREFMGIADAAPIRVTSVLNGAFLDMIGAEFPLVQAGPRLVLRWGLPGRTFDLTAKDDVAAYVAAVADDETSPRFLRIAGDTVSSADVAALATGITGRRWRTVWVGPARLIGGIAAGMRARAGETDDAFPAWQGLQYTRDVFEGRGTFEHLDNDRYPGLAWTSMHDRLRELLGPSSAESISVRAR